MHRKKYTPVHWFQTIPRVGQCSPHDHAHGVVQVASTHFVRKTGGESFFGELGHEKAYGEAIWVGRSILSAEVVASQQRLGQLVWVRVANHQSVAGIAFFR
jgi:hypothetical protein